MVCGYGHTAGDTLIKHPDVRMVSFTGSTRTGNLIAHAAADDFKRYALEMGGKSASVILPDADLAAAVKGTINNCLLNSGQTCTALTRMLVPADKHDEVTSSRRPSSVTSSRTAASPRRKSSGRCCALFPTTMKPKR